MRSQQNLHTAFEVNIQIHTWGQTTNYLHRGLDAKLGKPDFNCHSTSELVLSTENKRGIIFERDWWNISRLVNRVWKHSVWFRRFVIMCQYCILSTYENHWFLRWGPINSRTLPSNHTSSMVLKAYAYRDTVEPGYKKRFLSNYKSKCIVNLYEWIRYVSW